MKVIYSIFVVSILASCSTESQTSNLPIMGDLPLGVHGVGFKTLFTHDETRNAVPYADWQGAMINNHLEEKGRQFQINIWYPAQAGSGTSLTFEHYIHLMGSETNFDLTEEQKKFGEQLYITQTNELGAEGKFTKEELGRLTQLEVLAQLDAEAEPGKFPVVVLPNGSSTANHSITAEFLASHGYVIVGFAPKGRFSSVFEVSTIGLETAVDDLEFVLGVISKLPNADMDRVSLVANAIYSSVCASAVCKNPKINSLVSIEGGLPSNFEQQLLKGSAFYAPENFVIPSLFLYAPHPSIDPKHTFHLINSRRHYAHLPNMSEYAVLNYGMFDSIIPDIIGAHEGGTQRGFEMCNKVLLRFLNKYMKESEMEIFDKEFLMSATGIIDTTFVLEALPHAPNIAAMKEIFVKNGFPAIDSIYQELKSTGNPQPFSTSLIIDLRRWLGWGSDPENTARRDLYELAFDSYPESSLVNYYLALYSMRTGNSLKASKHYKKAIELLEVDRDPLLDFAERNRIRTNSQKALEDLG